MIESEKRSKEKIDFKKREPQEYYDSWRAENRILHYYGRCVICHRACYGFEDGHNDPRGILGIHAVSMLHADEYDIKGEDITACFMCMNEESSYNKALEKAKRHWIPKSNR